MKGLLAALVFAVLPAVFAAAAPLPRYAVAVTPTPVLNTPAFREVFGGTLRLDPCRGVRPVEFVALPGTLFRIEAELEKEGVPVYRVTTKEYPFRSSGGYFVDARFLEAATDPVRERPRALPPLVEVQRRLVAALGKPYVWGGNLQDGVPLLRVLYPQGDPLAGIDCSGLLYQATDGFTPRNSSALTSFGEGVKVAGLSARALAGVLKPLDLITWKGHVMIVLDGDSIIESVMGCKGGGGVRIRPRLDALRGLLKSRRALDDYPPGGAGAPGFVVRRWFPL